VVMLFSYLN